MEDSVAIAVASAVVATSVTLVVSQLKKLNDAKDLRSELSDADRAGYTRGWYEGRESILQQFQPKTPQDLVDR